MLEGIRELQNDQLKEHKPLAYFQQINECSWKGLSKTGFTTHCTCTCMDLDFYCFKQMQSRMDSFDEPLSYFQVFFFSEYSGIPDFFSSRTKTIEEKEEMGPNQIQIQGFQNIVSLKALNSVDNGHCSFF